MTNLKTEYSRKINKSSFLLTPEKDCEEEKDSIEMFRYHQIPYFLNMQEQKKDAERQFCYDITGKRSLVHLLEYKILDYQLFQKIITSFDQACIQAENYMLTENDILLKPEFVFAESDSGHIVYCYLPGNHEDICRQFQEFMEYLLKFLEHKDERAVQLAYGIYQKVIDEHASLHNVLTNTDKLMAQGPYSRLNIQESKKKAEKMIQGSVQAYSGLNIQKSEQKAEKMVQESVQAYSHLNKAEKMVQESAQVYSGLNVQESVRTSESLDIRESVQTPESLNVQESVRTPGSLNIRESVRIPENMNIQESVRTSESMNIQESVRTPESMNIQESIRIPESMNIQESVRTPEKMMQENGQTYSNGGMTQERRSVSRKKSKLQYAEQNIRDIKQMYTKQNIELNVKLDTEQNVPNAGRMQLCTQQNESEEKLYQKTNYGEIPYYKREYREEADQRNDGEILYQKQECEKSVHESGRYYVRRYHNGQKQPELYQPGQYQYQSEQHKNRLDQPEQCENGQHRLDQYEKSRQQPQQYAGVQPERIHSEDSRYEAGQPESRQRQTDTQVKKKESLRKRASEKLKNMLLKNIYTDRARYKEEETVFEADTEEEMEIQNPTVCLMPENENLQKQFVYQGSDRTRDFYCIGQKMILGSDKEESDIYIPIPMVSRVHARIEVDELGTFLEDMNSTNGTHVNGELLQYHERRMLQKGDIISLAGESYSFH